MTRHTRFRLWAGCAMGLCIGFSALSVALFPSIVLSTGFVIAQATLSLAAIPFFITAMGRFRTQMHRVYILLSIGIGLMGLAQLFITAVILADIQFIITSGLIGVPFFLGTLLVYVSIRRFVQFLDIPTRLTRWWLAGAITLGGAVMAACLPLVVPGVQLRQFSGDIGFVAWNGIAAFLAALLLGRASRRVSSIYSVALGRLNLALSVVGFGAIHYILVALFVPFDGWYVTHGAISVPFAIGSALFIWAGISFNFIGEPEEGAPTGGVTSLQIITYVASLATDQKAIDPLLDDVRSVSATLAPDTPLTPEMQSRLATAYLALEAYLTGEESVQAYTTTLLRHRVVHALRVSETDPTTFWPLLTPPHLQPGE